MTDIWISLDERPPPVVVTDPKLLLRFRSKYTGDVDMGYYLGEGEVRILGHSIVRQLPLRLEEIEAWQAVDQDQLRKIEDAELGPHAAG